MMIRCNACKEENRPAARYCRFCGQPLLFTLDRLNQNLDRNPAMPVPVHLVSGFRSHTGKRRENNEDGLLVLQCQGSNAIQVIPNIGLYAVADGVGGQEAGELASQVALQNLANGMIQHVLLPATSGRMESLGAILEAYEAAIHGANFSVLEKRKQVPEAANMGCTLTTALVVGDTVMVANVGDSRTYRLHDGHLEQVTRDHSIVALLVEQGAISLAQMDSHEQKSIIYRCLGDASELELDLFTFRFEVGDRLLLCSDGLWEMVREPVIKDILIDELTPQQVCDRLLDLANQAGGDDNISLIVVDLRPD